MPTSAADFAIVQHKRSNAWPWGTPSWRYRGFAIFPWTVGQTTFTLRRTLPGDHGPVFLIRGLDPDGPPHFFSYSKRKGVEALMYAPKEGFEFGTTFFLNGSKGPLAD
jgi:hypothetical protein